VELSYVLATFSRFKALVLSVLLATALLMGLWRMSKTEWYEAKAVLVVSEPQLVSGSTYSNNPDRFADTQVTYLQSNEFIDEVLTKLPQETRESVRASLAFNRRPGTDVIEVVGSGINGARAARISNTVANTFITNLRERGKNRFSDQIDLVEKQLKEADDEIDKLTSRQRSLGIIPSEASDELDRQILTLFSNRNALEATRQRLQLDNNYIVTSEIIQRAEPKAVARQYPKFIVFGVFLGGGLGLLLALMLAAGPRRIVSEDELQTFLNPRTVGSLGYHRTLKNGFWRNLDHRAIDPARGNELIRLSVQISSLVKETESALTVLVVGVGKAAGTTTLAAALATRFASSGQRTILFDGDTENPALSSSWKSERGGFAALAQRSELNAASVGVPAGPSGVRVIDQGDYLQSARALKKIRIDVLTNILGHDADVVIIDGGSLEDTVSSVRFAAAVDVVVVAVASAVQAPQPVESVGRLLSARTDNIVLVKTQPKTGGELFRSFGLKTRSAKPNVRTVPQSVEAMPVRASA
jgi:MinD-like ATPase involved in chromosome partitioning or flagellar assembly/capsular polysaccharide biosynthesis protein